MVDYRYEAMFGKSQFLSLPAVQKGGIDFMALQSLKARSVFSFVLHCIGNSQV